MMTAVRPLVLVLLASGAAPPDAGRDAVPAGRTGPVLRPAAPEPQKPSGRIEFRIRTKHARGPVRCGLYDQKKAWLTEGYVFRATGRVSGRMAVCVFEGVPPGRYAASAYHDENDNGDLDRNFIGLPSEDFCFSSGARAGLGPPSFSDADFHFDGGLLTISGRM